MCGIIAAYSQRPVADTLIDGLGRLAYRGYDSAGLALLDESQQLHCLKRAGKVSVLQDAYLQTPIHSYAGIAHTRWATHGPALQHNAHPHCSQHIAVVHNGIVENHHELRQHLQAQGYQFTSDTDSEVIAHLIHNMSQLHDNFKTAILQACAAIKGSLALAILNQQQPDSLYGYRRGSSLLVGHNHQTHFLASDAHALAPHSTQCIVLEDNDLVEIQANCFQIFDADMQAQTRTNIDIIAPSRNLPDEHTPDEYDHFMQKEIYQQPQAVANTLTQNANFKLNLSTDPTTTEACTINTHQLLSTAQKTMLKSIKRIQIIACGSSYHAAMVAQHWLEQLLKIPVRTAVASEYRFLQPMQCENTLLLCISQSGETADTLAALAMAKLHPYRAYAAICNVVHSSLARQVDLLQMTYAGQEISVAATKTFSCQLTACLQLALTIAWCQDINSELLRLITAKLPTLPAQISACLQLDAQIADLAPGFIDKQHALFLGRGIHFPIALEGALKLKETAYIHAEAYPSGELKHGPLALIDHDMPVIVVAPQDKLWDKLAANIAEVATRGAKVYIFADEKLNITKQDYFKHIAVPHIMPELSPFLQTITMQCLAYHIAKAKGCAIDQPRNLAKSVTVE